MRLVACSRSAFQQAGRRYSTASEPVLAGTAPHYTRHLVLHTPHPSSSWPSHLDAVSPLIKALGRQLGKLPNVGLGVAVDSKIGDGSRFNAQEVEASYSATLFPDFLSIPSVSLSSIPSLISFITSLPPHSPSATKSTTPRTHIFICTHTARDCRCGILGSPLYESLLDEARRRGFKEDEVVIREIAHVGGHRYAANALVYRENGDCDWYGLLRASDAPRLLSVALNPSASALNKWFPRWRGQLGLSPAAARALFQSSAEGSKGRRTELRGILGDQIMKIRFRTWDKSEEWEVEGWEGENLMEVAKRHDLPSIVATCGGHCECATCHVILQGENAPVSPIKDEEEEQLDFALGKTEGSRLACQIPLTKALERWCRQGGVIGLPRY